MAVYTFLHAQSFLQDSNRLDTSDRAERNYLRIANQALGWMHTARRWLHMRKQGAVQFYAPYATGTVAVSVGSNAVVGTGTAFTAAMVGRYILFGGDRRPYLIAVRGSGTALTLQESFKGLAGADPVDFDGTYQILDLCEALPSDFLELESPAIGTVMYRLQPTLNLSTILLVERWINYIGIPREYAIARDAVAARLWLWPVPATFNDVTFWYYASAPAITTTSDSFSFPDVQGVQGMIEGFLSAALDDFNGLDATASKQTAMGLLNGVARTLEPMGELGGRTAYGFGVGRNSFRGLFAPGIKDN